MGTNIPRPTKRPPTPALDPIIREYRTNCPNCCAVITGPICEYCGTRFSERYMMHRSTEGEEFIIPLNLTGDQVEKTKDAFIRFQSVAHDFGLPIQKQRWSDGKSCLYSAGLKLFDRSYKALWTDQKGICHGKGKAGENICQGWKIVSSVLPKWKALYVERKNNGLWILFATALWMSAMQKRIRFPGEVLLVLRREVY